MLVVTALIVGRRALVKVLVNLVKRGCKTWQFCFIAQEGGVALARQVRASSSVSSCHRLLLSYPCFNLVKGFFFSEVYEPLYKLTSVVRKVVYT